MNVNIPHKARGVLTRWDAVKFVKTESIDELITKRKYIAYWVNYNKRHFHGLILNDQNDDLHKTNYVSY
jgi:hypothetical protein